MADESEYPSSPFSSAILHASHALAHGGLLGGKVSAYRTKLKVSFKNEGKD